MSKRLTQRAEEDGVKAVWYGNSDVFLEGEAGYAEADKLAHYEDLGFTPEEIALLAKFYKEHTSVSSITADMKMVANSIELQRYKDLEKQGRLIELPCAVGDTVYTNYAMRGWYFRKEDRPYPAKVVFIGLNNSEEMGGGLFHIVYGRNNNMLPFNFSDIGKNVFLTKEEAEAKLKEAGEQE